MKKTNSKKLFTVLILSSLTLTALLAIALMSSSSASAKFDMSPSNTSTMSASSAALSLAAQTGVVMPRTTIFALDTDNTIFALVPGTTGFVRLFRVADAPVDGNLIGIDFRPAAGPTVLYAVTDTGKIYTIGLTAATLGRATLISTISPTFPDGYQSLADFNPVVDALRLIGSSTLNYAVVNVAAANGIAAANLGATAVQTSLTYNGADVNSLATTKIAPRVAAGAYTNNVVGAKATIFYGFDTQTDSMITIDPAAPGGSSATGAGVLRTIGRLVTPAGGRVKLSPTADCDIYTLIDGTNRLVGVSGRTFFMVDLNQATQATALGTTTDVVVNGIAVNADTGGRFIDVAAAPVVHEAEFGIQGGGNKVDTNIVGFSGTGFVNFADNVAGGFTEFPVIQAGPQTLIFKYSNGSAVNRPCNVTVNGTVVGTLAFPPTGNFGTYRLARLNVTLPGGSGFKAVRLTANTAAGGPNLDTLSVQ